VGKIGGRVDVEGEPDIAVHANGAAKRNGLSKMAPK
jgi:hypothetical protein